MRQTGIPVIGEVPWGTHFCQFYQDRQDLIDILVPYFKAGLENNEFCMWITSEPLGADEAKAVLAAAVPGLARCLDAGQLEILDHSQWYTAGGKFDSERVLSGWADRLDRAVARGFDGLRLSGNTFWLEKSDWRSFTEYEAAVDSVIGRRRMLAICTYSLERCGVVEIMDVVSNHAFALIKRSGKWEIIESTERKKVEASLRESEARLRSIAEAGRIGFFEWNPSRDSAYWSPEQYELLGFEPGSPVAWQRWLRGVHPDDRERLEERTARLLERARSEGHVRRHKDEYRFVRDGGSVAWLEADMSVDLVDGEPVIRGSVRDITERKAAEEALRRSEARWNAAIESFAEGAIIATEDERVIYWNPAAREMHGFTRPDEGIEPLEKTPGTFQLWLPDGSRMLELDEWPMRRIRRGESVRNLELRIRRPDQGWEKVFSYSGAMVETAGGERLIFLSCSDLTERRRAEQALRASEERLSALYKSMAEGLAIHEVVYSGGQAVDYVVTDVNPAFERILNLSRATVIGRTATEIYGSAAYLDVYAKVAEGAPPRSFETYFAPMEKHFAVSVFSPGPGKFATVFSDISARKQAEEALRLSESRFRQVVESLPQMVWTCLPDGPCDWLSPQWIEYTGVPEAPQLGFGWLEQVHPEDRDRVVGTWQETARHGEHFTIEFRIRRRDGSYRWFRTLAVPLRDDAGRIVKWFGSNTDIDDIKEAEQALRQSRLDLDRAQAVGQIGSWRLDTRRNVLTWSEENHRIFGLPVGTPLTYETFLEVVHPDDRRYVDARWNAALCGEPYDIEHRLVVAGQLKWVREKAYLEFDDAGNHLGGFGITQDITERRLAEEKIRHQNATLEAMNRIFSEALLCDAEEELGRRCLRVIERVTESSFGFIGEIDPEGRLDAIAMSGPGWEAGGNPDFTGSRRPPAGFEIDGVYRRLVLEGRGFFTNDAVSRRDGMPAPEGHPALKAFLGVPLKHDSETIGMIAVGNRAGGYRPQDLECLEALAVAVVQVLMRKRAERAVRESEERLRQAQKMESIGVLAGGIAHDFNNLLTGILGNASLLQMDPEAGAGRKLKAIIESSEKAAALTRQLLAYAGKGQFQIADFDVARLVRSSADLLRVSIPRNVGLELDVPRSLPSVRGDSSQIHQVIMNLVINAAEATEGRSDGRVSIGVGVREFDAVAARRVGSGIAPGHYVSITVADNGCGMDEQTRPKIFEPFFTTKFTGRGLGLAAVHGILRSHKGAITVETTPGQGSTFTVYLPSREAPSPAASRAPAISGARESATVLVVDDEEPVRAFTQAALERLGHRVLLANDGRQALDVLAAHRDIELVLLDVVMPVVGGVEAFGEMRKRWPNLAVLVASGYSRQEASRMGMPRELPFLAKPFTVQMLAAAIEKALKTQSRQDR